MECHAVEVGYGLVDVYGRGTMSQSARLIPKAMGFCIPGESFGQHRLNEGVLIVKEKHRGGCVLATACVLSGSSWSWLTTPTPVVGLSYVAEDVKLGGELTT